MKKLILLLAILMTYCTNLEAQTYFTPFDLQTKNENVNLRLNNGATFVGRKFSNIINGNVTAVYYYGTITMPSGERYITQDGGSGFDANFGLHNATIWCIRNGVAYCQTYMNNRVTNEYKEGRNYTINGPYIVFPTTYYGGGGYDSGSSSGSYNSGSSGSTYNSHTATCRGCNASGRCQHCGGTGLVNNNKSKCSLCHGTGRCVSCGGTGKIHGNF